MSEEGAEWLAQENKRLAGYIETLKHRIREFDKKCGETTAKLVDLEARHEALESKYWSMRTVVTELADDMRKDDK